MRFGLTVIAVTSIIIPIRAGAADEIPLLPDAEYFRSVPVVFAASTVMSIPEPVPQRTAHISIHPLAEKSSLFGGAGRRDTSNGESPPDTMFARRPISVTLERSLLFHGANKELFPTLPSLPDIGALPLPGCVGVNQLTNPRTMPIERSDQPVILQSGFQEFPRLD